MKAKNQKQKTTERTTPYKNLPISKEFQKQSYADISKGRDKFTDTLFPPDDTSLYSSKPDRVEYTPEEIPAFLKVGKPKKFLSQFALGKKDNAYTWKRLSELFNPKDLNVLKESKTPYTADIVQGELGDCYFLSVLHALAENPDNIKSLLPSPKINDKGVYETEVFLHGEPTRVVVDDYVPVTTNENGNEQIAFAGVNPETGNIWPVILEKAWAKCNLSYEDIATGKSAEAFEFLTGAPVDTYYHNAQGDELFNKIKEALDKGYIILSEITDTENTNLDFLSKMGLITNHAYSVIDAVVLKDNFKNEIRLVKIKNNWGTNEWLGDWSDGSRKWTNEFKDKVGLDEKEDGVFWMSYEDFLAFYTSTNICKMHNNYSLVNEKVHVNPDEPFSTVNINVPKDTNGYFEVNMKNRRLYKHLKGQDEFENPYCSMTVFRKDGDDFAFIGSDAGKQNRLYVECPELQRGNYYVAVTFPEASNGYDEDDNGFKSHPFDKMSCRIGLYSPFNDVKIVPVSDKDKANLTSFYDDIVENVATANPDKYYFVQEGEKDSWRAINFENSNNGFGYIYYHNNSDAFIRERATFTQLDNVNIIPLMKDGQFTPVDITTEDEVEYEDPTTRVAISSLKENAKLNSSVEVISPNDKKQIVSEKNPVELQFNIAPHSKCIVLLQKTSDEAEIDFTSDICIDYLPNALITEEKFRPKRVMLKYNDKPVEIYECITEHNTGVLFQYKNKTSDIKLGVTVNFTSLNNLFLEFVSDDALGEGLKLRQCVDGKFREDDENGNAVSLVVKPGETKFFGVKAIDEFKKFSYNSKIDYRFNKHFGNEDKNVDESEEQD